MLEDLKNIVRNNLLIINDNRNRASIKVTDQDINNVYDLLESDDIDSLKQCSYEMDDIINGIIISIDNELKELLGKSSSTDLTLRREILSKIISITNSIRYDYDNKTYFMGLIKQIYNNIDGDNL